MNFTLSDLFHITKNPRLAEKLISEIKKLLKGKSQPIRIMEFCGGHTHTLLKYGIDEIFMPEIEFLHGPGCPVCVLSSERLEMALKLAEERNSIFITYGDLLRVSNSEGKSLLSLRAEGYDIRMVSNAMEAMSIAKENLSKKVIFFAIGFETTAPATAFLIVKAKSDRVSNLKVISNHLLTPPVLDYLFERDGVYVDGIIGPGHVCAVMGAKAYEKVSYKFEIPIVIAGFEPLDLLEALYLLIRRIYEKKVGVEIAYRRVVTYEGNPKAQELMKEVFEERDFPWRGLGIVAKSGLGIKDFFSDIDGEYKWAEPILVKKYKACLCNKILQGKAKPIECKLFGKACRPETPIGPCMVSSEGACLAYFKYKGLLS
ncbi:MAG: hydrogenase formation protein HypD [Caldimicrobium sp.]